jgi:hypothetical protein
MATSKKRKSQMTRSGTSKLKKQKNKPFPYKAAASIPSPSIKQMIYFLSLPRELPQQILFDSFNGVIARIKWALVIGSLDNTPSRARRIIQQCGSLGSGLQSSVGFAAAEPLKMVTGLQYYVISTDGLWML